MKFSVLLARFYFLCLKNDLCDCCGLFSIALVLQDLSFLIKKIKIVKILIKLNQMDFVLPWKLFM